MDRTELLKAIAHGELKFVLNLLDADSVPRVLDLMKSISRPLLPEDFFLFLTPDKRKRFEEVRTRRREMIDKLKLFSTEVWAPDSTQQPPAAWRPTAPGCLLIAADLLREGKALHEMTRWRDFEELVAYLLEQDGWTVELTTPSDDGGVDVFAVKSDAELGPIQTVWQAKKYKPTQKVGISCIRELAHVRDEVGASKAFIVTTSFLTRGALAKVQRDEYRLGAKDKPAVEQWVRRELGDRA